MGVIVYFRDIDPNELMKEEYWKYLSNFSKDENWGDWTKMKARTMFGLQALREFLGCPLYILNAHATSGHTTKSLHYVGAALDLHCKSRHKLLDFYLMAERMNFWGGIGVYPHWFPHPGIHIDTRSDVCYNRPGARWMGIKKQIPESNKKKQIYVSLDNRNIKRYITDIGI